MNTKKIAILIIGTLFLLVPIVKAQSKFHVILDYHYNLGLSEKYWERHLIGKKIKCMVTHCILPHCMILHKEYRLVPV